METERGRDRKCVCVCVSFGECVRVCMCVCGCLYGCMFVEESEIEKELSHACVKGKREIARKKENPCI